MTHTNFLTNGTAKCLHNSGGGNSQVQTNKSRFTTYPQSLTTEHDKQRRASVAITNSIINATTPQGKTLAGSLRMNQVWKYAACMLLTFVLGLGNVWGEDFTINPITGSYIYTSLAKVTINSPSGDKLKISSGQIQTSDKNQNGYFTIATTHSSLYIKGVSFTDANKGSSNKLVTLENTSGDGTLTNNATDAVWTYSGGTTSSVSFKMTAGTGGAGKLGTISITVASSENNIETLSGFSLSSGKYSFTSKVNNIAVTSAVSLTTPTSSGGSVSGSNISLGSNKTITFTSENNIKYIAFFDNNCRATFSVDAGGGTCDGGTWTAGTDTKTITLKNAAGTTLSGLSKVFVITESLTKHTVTYDLNGGTGVAPTQADVAEGGTFTVAAMPGGVTPPTGTKFSAWNDGNDDYEAGDTYTMGTSDVTLTAQWVEDVPDPTATFTGGTYIIGASALNMAAKFTSNSTGAVTYALKETTTNASITSAGAFTATVAGSYVVVASQAAVTGTYAAISKEATVTVLDNELSDTYVWKKNASYTGCIANPNADAPAAQYTDIAYEGFTGMGRAAADNTECILTFTVKAAYSANFGIKSICTYGKLEEPAGGQISWDGGSNWEDLAAYAEGKKEFNAPVATYPASFKIKFLGVSASSGGLYWRNALVTLTAKKTVTGTVEELTNVKVNGTAIASTDLATLKTNKSLAITTTYATAPTITFVKRTTVSYSGGWDDDVTSEEIDVEASENTTNWSASTTINSQAYTVTLAKPAGPSLETVATGLTLTSTKIATDTKSFTFSGVNLGTTNVTISLASAVAGMTVSPTSVTPTAGAITDQKVTVTYKSLEDVASANVNLVVYYDESTKLIIPLTYSSTAGIEDLTPISTATTWNWDGAASAAVGTVVDKAQMIILANADVTWDEGFNARAIAGKLEHMYRDGKYAQGDELKFKTTIPGKVFVTYSNTGGNAARTVNVNGVKGSLSSSNNKDADKCTESFAISAGDVLIKGVQVSDNAAKYLRYYEVRFAQVYAVTYAAGDGAVKSGETMPTQADEAAGEKITLAAATVLEKDGYDFTGWLCNVDSKTYQPGDDYEMTATATTFTAQWVLHVDPVDPTLTYKEGAYMVGAAALDLSTLITASNSTGAITYSVKDVGTTGATLDGKKLTATAVGTAIITASQAAVPGYNAKTVDFNVVVTEPTEIDGIKLVEAGALTGKFRVKADQLKSGEYTVESINYTKYVQMGSTHTSFSGETEGNQAKGIYYAPAKKNIKFWFYMRNTDSSAKKIYIYKMEEGSTVASETVSVDQGSQLVSYDMTLSTNAEVIFGVESTKLYFCQIVAVESGDDLLQGGQNGYVFDYSKKRQNVAANAKRTIDGIEYYLSAESKINSASNVQLTTLGTHYIKFHLDAPMTVNVYSDNKKYYIGSECSTDANAQMYESTGDGEFSLAAGDWYINGSGNTVKINKIAFSAPKCEQPAFSGALANSDICAGDPYVALNGTATVSDGGTVTYQWYNADSDEAIEGATNATYTPNADGRYYVIATNQREGFSDNSKKSDAVTVTTYAGTVITAYENVMGAVGAEKTLSVTAEGRGTLHYAWYTCDNEAGNNPVAVSPANDAATYAVTITEETQYYKVVVTGDCGNASQVLKAEVRPVLAQVTVTGSTTWDWSKAGINVDLGTSQSFLLANNDGIVNDETFNSQALQCTGRYPLRDGKYFQGRSISMNVIKEGIVKVTFSNTGGNAARTIRINGKYDSTISSTSASGKVTYEAYVETGIVMLDGIQVSDEEGADLRIYQIVFTAKEDIASVYAEDNRNLMTSIDEMRFGEIGTYCPEKEIAHFEGATFYALAGGLGTTGHPTMLLFSEVSYLEAGKPYIYVLENATFSVIEIGNAVAEPVSYNGFYGSFDGINRDGSEPEAMTGYFIVSDNTIRLCGNNCKVGKHRGYFDIYGNKGAAVPCYSTKEACYNAFENPGGGAAPAPRKRVALNNTAANQATALDNVEERYNQGPSDQGLSAKEGCYDVLGRRVAEPQQNGVYILNGKKLIIVK